MRRGPWRRDRYGCEREGREERDTREEREGKEERRARESIVEEGECFYGQCFYGQSGMGRAGFGVMGFQSLDMCDHQGGYMGVCMLFICGGCDDQRKGHWGI